MSQSLKTKLDFVQFITDSKIKATKNRQTKNSIKKTK